MHGKRIALIGGRVVAGKLACARHSLFLLSALLVSQPTVAQTPVTYQHNELGRLKLADCGAPNTVVNESDFIGNRTSVIIAGGSSNQARYGGVARVVDDVASLTLEPAVYDEGGQGVALWYGSRTASGSFIINVETAGACNIQYVATADRIHTITASFEQRGSVYETPATGSWASCQVLKNTSTLKAPRPETTCLATAFAMLSRDRHRNRQHNCPAILA